MKQFSATISGKVQGVFFRDFVQTEAEKLRIVGWVRNEPNGDVRIVAQGGEAFLKKFERSVRKGSELSKVEFVALQWEEPTETFEYFDIVTH